MGRHHGALDECVVIDWSAASSPKRGPDSIWVARGRRGAGVVLDNPPTRKQAWRLLLGALEEAVERSRRTLVAFDFSFGYPAGAAGLLRSPAASTSTGWRRVWSTVAGLVVDDEGNANNRFAVADSLNRHSGCRLFWGRPRGPRYEHLVFLPTRDEAVAALRDNPLDPYRVTERCAPRRPKSNWQLLGRGTVGGQVLTGLPYLEALKGHFGARLGVWPLETGLGDPFSSAQVVMAEVWPSMFLRPGAPDTPVRDARQVTAVAQALLGCGDDRLATLFSPPSLGALPSESRRRVTDEEGWILGVT